MVFSLRGENVDNTGTILGLLAKEGMEHVWIFPICSMFKQNLNRHRKLFVCVPAF